MSQQSFTKDFAREIESQNSLKKFIVVVLQNILPQLEPFVGKKIFKTDGSKMKAFTVETHLLQPEPIKGVFIKSHNTYLTCRYQKLELKIGICVNGGSYDVKPATAFTKYTDRTIELGDMKDGQTLENLTSLEDIIKMYRLDDLLDFEDELAKVRNYKYHLKQAEDAKSKIKVDQAFYKYID